MNPKELIVSEEFLNRIDTVCKKRFFLESDADSCYLFILDKLQEDNFRRLREFSGRSTLKTFSYALINNLAADYKRKLYGRKRVPTVVTRLGQWAEAVYKFVCWQKFSWEDAYEMIVLDQLYQDKFTNYIKDISPIQKAPCHENPSFVSTEDDEQPDIGSPNQTSNPLALLLEKLEQKKRIKAAGLIRQITSEMVDEDKLLVKLIYSDDISIARAAKVLGKPAATVNRRLKKLLLEYKETLLLEGIRA